MGHSSVGLLPVRAEARSCAAGSRVLRRARHRVKAAGLPGRPWLASVPYIRRVVTRGEATQAQCGGRGPLRYARAAASSEVRRSTGNEGPPARKGTATGSQATRIHEGPNRCHAGQAPNKQAPPIRTAHSAPPPQMRTRPLGCDERPYVNVRRPFSFLEESSDTGTHFVVFEPKYDATKHDDERGRPRQPAADLPHRRRPGQAQAGRRRFRESARASRRSPRRSERRLSATASATSTSHHGASRRRRAHDRRDGCPSFASDGRDATRALRPRLWRASGRPRLSPRARPRRSGSRPRACPTGARARARGVRCVRGRRP
jgi:hypothetical protein